MSIVVTGATGQFGRLAIEALLRRGVPAENVVAVGRNVAAIADLADRGVVVRQAEYGDPETLRAAFAADGAVKPVYELGGEAFTLAELAATISRLAGREVTYTDLPEAEYAQLLARVGVPAPMPAILADADRGAAKGELFTEVTDL